MLLHLGCLLRGDWLDLLRRWLLLLARNGRALRHVAAEIACQFAFVVGIDLGVILPARDGHVSHAAIDQLLAFLRVHVDQHALSSLALAAVAGHCVTVIEMRMLADIERDLAA